MRKTIVLANDRNWHRANCCHWTEVSGAIDVDNVSSGSLLMETKLSKLLMLRAALAFFAIALIIANSSPARAQKFPAKPFVADVNLTDNSKKAVGPGAGTLGVTSLTISNYSSSLETLFIFAPVLSGASCSASVTGGGEPALLLELEPKKTLQLTFPTPLIFNKISGVSCLAAEVTTSLNGGSVRFLANGFSQ
jgi:hypothetical protein